jgi:hypothetical protein
MFEKIIHIINNENISIELNNFSYISFNTIHKNQFYLLLLKSHIINIRNIDDCSLLINLLKKNLQLISTVLNIKKDLCNFIQIQIIENESDGTYK